MRANDVRRRCDYGGFFRTGEARGLRWRNVDVENGIVRVREQLGKDNRPKPPKTGSALQDVHISPALATMLSELREAARNSGDDNLVFCAPDGAGIDYTTVWRNFDKAVTAAGLADDARRLSPHCLRHYFASLLIAEGLNVVYVSKQLGHADVSVTLGTYAHEFERVGHAAQAREALEREQRRLVAVV